MSENFIILFTFFFAIQFSISNGKVMGVVGEKLYECEELPKNQQTDAVDFSNFIIHQENDTHTYLDGSVKFLAGFTRLPGRVYLEQYVRGKWIVQIFDRTYLDMCVTFHNPVEPFYNQTKSFPNCPVLPGTEWKFEMKHIRGSDKFRAAFPSHLTGLWRMTVTMEFFVDGAFKKVCRKAHCDIFEV